MSETVAPLAALLPGDVVLQGRAIMARLRLAFPENKFEMRFLPPRIDRNTWKVLSTSGQPFLGLGFEGIVSQKSESRAYRGFANWVLLVAVRASGRPEERYFGDSLGVGVLTYAPLAAAMLHGWAAGTGTAIVTKITNVVSDEWAEDSSIIGISFEVPIVLRLHDLIQRPEGLGIFKELAETWVIGGPTGITTTYTSDWENPHVEN